MSTKQEDEKETLKPNAVVHIDANILPEDIEKELGKAMYFQGETHRYWPDSYDACRRNRVD